MKTPQTQRHAVDLLQALPAVPKIAQEILSIEMASDKANETLLKLVEKDPAISARIIGLANTPLFARTRKIMSVSDAATVLGIKRVKMFALSFAMISSMPRHAGGLLKVTDLWKHSMSVALAMDALSKAMPLKMRPPDEEIYLAGLLHDIGFLVLEYIDPDLSNRFHARLGGGEQLAAQIEAEMLEMNHCELGALLAQHWNLSEGIVEVLRLHHQDDTPREALGQPLISMTSLAERLLPTFGMAESVPSKIGIDDWLKLGVAADRVEEVEASMRQRATEIASALA